MIGRKPFDKDNVYIATGDSGNGMTHGTIAGMLLCDLILNKKNPWEKLYDPARFRLGATKEFLKENMGTASAMTAYITPGSVFSEETLSPGNGGIAREGIKKIALYRDEIGTVHRFSAVCPHKGCIVEWNALEKTFDCPCHGSRFDYEGKVVNGPAKEHLAPLKAESKLRQ
jgi:Rieske Fe-S protein